MKNINNLGWSERLALIEKFNPSDEQICDVFNVNVDELQIAREQQSNGNIQIANIDVDEYAELFAGLSSTSHASAKNKPQTATKTVREPKKRGRKGTKIQEAFAVIPNEPTPVDQFASAHNVSLNVLRQSKRFDKTGIAGTVKVKKDKETGALMIWREAE